MWGNLDLAGINIGSRAQDQERVSHHAGMIWKRLREAISQGRKEQRARQAG